jgi:hypothetical protein
MHARRRCPKATISLAERGQIMEQDQKRAAIRTPTDFYTVSLPEEAEDSQFYSEFTIILRTADAVNSFHSVYRSRRTGAKGGPSTHAQQDLYRAMLIFACAGLDIFVKQLIRTKLFKLIEADKKAEAKFKEHVRRGISKDDKAVLNTVALALIDRNPREIFLADYVEGMTGESLQSVEELCKVSEASGLDTKTIFDGTKRNLLKDAFTVRNQIIHEMDITVSVESAKRSGHRTRRQRRADIMEKHTEAILDLAQELFLAYKNRFAEFKIGIAKGSR